MRHCPCGAEITTVRGIPRCDACKVPHKHYPPGPNAVLTRPVVVRMPRSLHQQVKDAAAAEHMTMADWMRRALWDYVNAST